MNPPSPVRDPWSFWVHLTVYGTLLVIYFFLVLRYLTRWLLDLFVHHRAEFAIVAIVLMIGQAAGLEIISFLLLKLIRPRKKG